MNYPELSLEEMASSVELGAMCASKKVTCCIGPPGMGKTERFSQLAAKMNLPFFVSEFGMVPEEEAAGIFCLDPVTRKLERIPIGVFRQACERPVFLLADEVTRCMPARQSILMPLTDSQRRVGDAFLHPGSVVACAGNGADSAGTHPLVDAFVNRVNMCFVYTKREELARHVATRGAPGGTFNNLCVDYCATSQARPELFCERPPKGYSDNGTLWASGRAVVNGLERLAQAIDANVDPNSPVFHAQLAGNIGPEVAAIYLTARKLRHKLPTKEEIVSKPDSCKLPPDVESGIATLGLIALAAKENVNAAWVYAARLPDAEIQAAVARTMLAQVPTEAKALAAFSSMTGKAARAMKRG